MRRDLSNAQSPTQLAAQGTSINNNLPPPPPPSPRKRWATNSLKMLECIKGKLYEERERETQLSFNRRGNILNNQFYFDKKRSLPHNP